MRNWVIVVGFTVLIGSSYTVFAQNPSERTAHRPSVKKIHASYKKEDRSTAAHRAVKSVGEPKVRSASVLVVDQDDGTYLYEKNPDEVRPIASITKLMTAMVVLDAKLPLNQEITITEDDVDQLRHSASRLPLGTTLPRRELLRLALMSSENRAASALARTYPGGLHAFVKAMNRKARELGMHDTHFVDSTGLHSENVSTARDLAKMVEASYRYELIREFTTTAHHEVELGRRSLAFLNSNRLVANKGWEIGLSKTGFINEAGRCLVMQATIAGRKVIIVLLDSWGRLTRIGDANRIKRWMESRLLSGRSSG